MPVNVRVSQHKVEVKITNTTQDAQDERSRGPRYEYLNHREVVTLIRQLAGALERLEDK
jgi:hypothetical protein